MRIKTHLMRSHSSPHLFHHSNHSICSVRALSLSVILACNLIGGQALADNDWPLTLEALEAAGFEVKVTGDVHYIPKVADAAKDPLDNAFTWLWGTGEANGPSDLSITVNNTLDFQKTAGEFKDVSNTYNQKTIWISGGLKTYFGGNPYGLTETPGNFPYSETTNGNKLTLTVKEGATFLAKLFGSRNDLGGYDQTSDSGATANNNKVTVQMEDGSKLYAKLIFGGRSSQLDGIQGDNGIVHAGFETNSNVVEIKRFIPEGSIKDVGETVNPDTFGIVITKGIFGAEGYEANNNKVALENTVVVAGMKGARKLGLVGGRGLYYYRMNYDYEESTYKEVVNGATGYVNSNGETILYYPQEEEGDLKKVSAIANNNIVSVKNSYIGYHLGPAQNDWSWYDSAAEDEQVGFSIYGGWSTGVAMNNIVAAEDSTINGNVIGGLEFQDQMKITDGQLRDLHSNLVSLKDTTLLPGSSIYGTATATTKQLANDPYNRMDEGEVNAVNRRRGIAYIAGEVAADSAYVRYISFGQYLNTSTLDNNESYDVVRNYYPTEGSLVSEKVDLDLSDPLEKATVHLNDGDPGSIRLGELVAGSYLINRGGYHSSLAATGENQDLTATKGQHNFWVGAYANVSDTVDGGGTSFNTEAKLFNDNGEVNHGYAGGSDSLSLLTHDDGMWYSYTTRAENSGLEDENSNHRPALMHQFRYHYQGLVLYLGANDGTSGEPVIEISFDEIANFREAQNQNTNAFGNTFIGIIKDGTVYQKASDSEGDKTVDASLMTFDVPGFKIIQGEDHVADATYAFYKYMHFDGHDGQFEDENAAGETITVNGKVSDPGEAAGIGIKYWLKSVDIQPNKQLVLNGRLEDSELYVEDFQSGDTSKPKQELFTLSAELTGSGGVTIAKDSTVIIGSPDTIYNIDSDNTDSEPKDSGAGEALYDVVFKAPQPNSYTGDTIVAEGAMLALGIDGALGESENRYTSKLRIVSSESETKPSSVYLQGHTQTVGALNVEAGSVLDFNQAAPISFEDVSDKYEANTGSTGGELTVRNNNQISEVEQKNNGTWADIIDGNLKGTDSSKLIFIDRKQSVINSDNPDFLGTVELKSSSAYLTSPEALISAAAYVDKDSSLYFDIQKNTAARASALRAAENPAVGNHYNTVVIRGIENYGSVYLSHKIFGDNLGREATRSDASLNKVNIGNYEGKGDSVLYYQGFLGGPVGSENSSYVDVVYADTASGQSKVYFINEDGKFGAFSQSRGETVGEGGTNGILIFEVKDPNEHVDLIFPDGQTRIGVVAKDNETHVRFYRLNEQGDGNDWYLVNKADGDVAIPWTPIEPPITEEEPNEPVVPPEVPVVPPENPEQPEMPDNPTSPTPDDEGNTLRPEGGAYMANSQAWAKMHMRLHDRFGQAYYIDPFDGKEKPAAAWARQVGSHSHFKSGGGESRTHARTAVTQIGADLIRNEINEDWKYIGGVFAGGLYHRANTRTYASAKSRSDGYAVGIYGTLYTGNSPDDGFYVDSWLLYGRYDNKLWGETTSTFNYKSHGWVWSVESGYTIPLGESGTKDFNKVIWTFQPEVQVVWDGVKANDGYDATDTKYKQLGKDNVAIRVGARVHGNYMNKGLGFIEGNWIHNTKKTGVQMGSAKTYMDGGRNLGEFRMGLEGHITRNTLGWATVGVQAGKAGYHNETAQIGIKYMF